MNYQGTPGRVRVIQFDQNNARIDFDPSLTDYLNSTFPAGTYNEITIDASGRVISGVFNPPPIIPVVPVKQTNVPVPYVADPNAEGLTPLDPTQSCVAYSKDGTFSFLGWNIDLQIWN
jgi:hypothetical protein